SAAKRDVMPAVEHRSHKGLNNRAENSHVPLRKRERVMQGFRSIAGLQRFISIFSAIRNLFVPSSSHASMAPNRAPSRRMKQSLTPRSCFHRIEFTVPAACPQA
ncbi:DDE-type integrase/transposase/recombinase, partial [Rhizobium laguerreae]|uniref:DDE-type integrase/transposase/recombinase n=1 Tax=Rhizobium laguerreae TaxID=1076926 RepID=UPI0021B1322A